MGLPLEINNLPLCSPKSFECHHITVLGDFKTTSRQTGSMKVPKNTMYSAYIWSCEHPLLVALPHNTLSSNSCIRYIRRSGHCAQNVFLIPFLNPHLFPGKDLQEPAVHRLPRSQRPLAIEAPPPSAAKQLRVSRKAIKSAAIVLVSGVNILDWSP